MESGQSWPDPWLQFLDDLIHQICTWRKQHKAVLICMDTNDDVTWLNPKKGIGPLIAETNLLNLHHYSHQTSPRPPTYNQGQLTLNFCIRSPKFVLALKKSAILPFSILVHLPSNHWALLLDFDSQILFSNALPPSCFAPRQGVYSNAQLTVTKFCKLVGKGCDEARISNCIAEVEAKLFLNPEDHVTLDDIDRDITHILVDANDKCHWFKDFPWSPKLHLTFLEHWYWIIHLSKIRMKHSFQHALQLIQDLLRPHFQPLTPPETVLIQLWCTQAKIWEIHREAISHRKQFLDKLIKAAHITRDTSHKKLILGLKHAEETRQCFGLVRAILHPTTPGGLTHLILPVPNNNSTQIEVTDTVAMEQHLLDHSPIHFRLAQGTPYTVPPLSNLLMFDGLTPFGDCIFKGDPIPANLPINKATWLLLQNQHSLMQPHKQSHHTITFDLLMKGFKKWPKWTTTSPSRCHLGVYQSLLKDNPHPIHRLTFHCGPMALKSCNGYFRCCNLPSSIPISTNGGRPYGTCI